MLNLHRRDEWLVKASARRLARALSERAKGLGGMGDRRWRINACVCHGGFVECFSIIFSSGRRHLAPSHAIVPWDPIRSFYLTLRSCDSCDVTLLSFEDLDRVKQRLVLGIQRGGGSCQ